MSQDAAALSDDQLHIPALRGRARIRRAIAFVVVAALVAGGWAAWALRPKAAVEVYRFAPVTKRDITRRVEITGRLQPTEQVDVPAPIQARLISVSVEPGDQVRQGQVLARLDERMAALATRGARAGVQVAAGRVVETRAALEAAQGELDRTTQLSAQGLASAADLQRARGQVAQVQATLRAARAEQRASSERAAQAQLGENLAAVVAPIDGVVLSAPDRVGQIVGPESGSLFQIGASLETILIEAPLGEADIAAVQASQRAEFEVPAFPGRTFPAVVERIELEPHVREAAVTYPVVLRVSNPTGELLPGMTAAVQIVVATRKGTLAVPEAALRFTPIDADGEAPRSRVWRRVGKSEVEPIRFVRGIHGDGYVELLPSGTETLREGDQVAIGFASAQAQGNQPRVRLGTK